MVVVCSWPFLFQIGFGSGDALFNEMKLALRFQRALERFVVAFHVNHILLPGFGLRLPDENPSALKIPIRNARDLWIDHGALWIEQRDELKLASTNSGFYIGLGIALLVCEKKDGNADQDYRENNDAGFHEVVKEPKSTAVNTACRWWVEWMLNTLCTGSNKTVKAGFVKREEDDHANDRGEIFCEMDGFGWGKSKVTQILDFANSTGRGS